MEKYDEKQREDDEASIEDLCRMLEDYRDAFENKETENSALKTQIRDLQYENKVLKLTDCENKNRIRFLEDSLAQIVQEIDDLQSSLEKKQEECISLTNQLSALEAIKVTKLQDDACKQDILIAELRKEIEALRIELKERDEIIDELDEQLNLKESEMLDFKLEKNDFSMSSVMEHKKDENDNGKPRLLNQSNSPISKPNKPKKWREASLSPQSKQSNGKAKKDFPNHEKNNVRDRRQSDDDSYNDDKMDSEFAAAVLHANNTSSTGFPKGFASQNRRGKKLSENKYRSTESAEDEPEQQEYSRVRYISKAFTESPSQLEENLNSSTIVAGRHRYVDAGSLIQENRGGPYHPLPPPPPPQYTPVSSTADEDRSSSAKGREEINNVISSQKPSSKGGQLMDTLSRILYPIPHSNRTLSAAGEEDLKEGDESPVRGKLYSIYSPSSEYSNSGLDEECKTTQYYAHPIRLSGTGSKSDDDSERAGGTSSPDGFPPYAVRKRAVAGGGSVHHPTPAHRPKEGAAIDPPGPSFSTPKCIPSKK